MPKLPFIVKARYVSDKAEYVLFLSFSETRKGILTFGYRRKIKEAGGVVKLVA